MYKRVIILLSFLAYSLTLVHSLVPHHHHHHDEAKAEHHHHPGSDHHHPEQHGDNKSLSHVFAAAIHHPASELVILNPESERIQTSSNVVDLFIAMIAETIFLRRPPDPLTNYQEKHYSTQQDSFFLLRAPPVA